MQFEVWELKQPDAACLLKTRVKGSRYSNFYGNAMT